MTERLNMSEKDFLKKWIELYKSLPELWNRSHKDYNIKWKKQQSYEVLLKKYRKWYPEADIKDVKRKLNTLRTNFRKELRRVNRLKNNSSNNCSKPVSTLWYIDNMMFLADEEQAFSSTGKPKVEDEELSNSSEIEFVFYPAHTSHSKDGTEISPDIKENHVTLCKCSQNEENERNRMAQVWASELCKLDKEQQIHAKKAINDILYYGQLGKLNENIVIRLSSHK